MNWLDVAKVVAPLAPTLGGLLGGFIPFPGGALAGQMLGNLIAKQFGVEPTPEAVRGAITNNPNEVVLAKLNAAMEEAKAQWPAIARIEEAYARAQVGLSEQVNETMRAQIGREHWFFSGWRPAAGWLFDLFAAVFGAELSYALAQSAFYGNDKAITAITAAWPVFAVYLGSLAAMVGVYVIGRSQEKKEGAAQTALTPALKSSPARK